MAGSLIVLVVTAALAGAEQPEQPAWPAPMELSAPEMPTSVEDALGVQDASLFRKVGLGSLVTGGLLGVVSAAGFAFGLDAERELRAAPHDREAADALLFERGVAAAVAWPALVLGAVGVGAGAGLLIFEDARAGLSDGNEEVTP